MNTISKLTLRKMNLEKAELKDTAKLDNNLVARIYGRITASTEKASQFDPYIVFDGSFHGINTLTGEEFNSHQCILPALASSTIMFSMGDSLSEGGSFEFAFDIKVLPVEREDSLGYEFSFESLLKDREAVSPLASIAKDLPALPSKSFTSLAN